MGRPLNKKYFGNRNIGTGGNEAGSGGGQNFADDKIGGEGVGSVTINTAGTYTAGLPTVSFSTPALPGGVQTTGTVHGNALSAATTSNGTGYRVGDVLTVAGGTKTSAATFPVSAIVIVGTPTITNGGSLYDIVGAVGDRVTFTHANLSQAYIIEATSVSGSTITGFEVVQPGVWTGSGVAPTSMANGVSGFTATTSGGPTDNNGNGLVLGFTASMWGVYSFGTVAVQGDYTAMPANPASFTGGNGTGAAATVTFGVSGVVIDEAGSGYVNVADAAPTFSGGAAAGTSVLTTDSGVTNGMNAAGNNENAIVAYGWVDGGREVVDIIRQTNGRSYKIEGADGIVRSAKLVTDGDANADGEMDITATDFGGGTYRVAKISGRKATLVRKGSGSWEFATGASVPWTFTAAPAATALQSGYNVKIDNA
jgi:hypothetical protein